MVKQKKTGYFVLAVLIAAVTYAWSLWYYEGLYLSERLLSTSRVTAETLPRTLFQNIFVQLPEILAAIITLLLLGRSRFVWEMGLNVKSRKKFVLPLAAGACLLVLAAALLFTGAAPLAVGYQWVYYLLLVAFTEEFIFRGLLPFLMERGGAPVWVVWIIPGVLFACMHTLMPMVYNGFSLRYFIYRALAMLGGYTAGHCGFYALRRWSGTLWLPVLIHGLLDFLSIFTK